MASILDVVLPVFGIILAGFIIGRSGVLGAQSSGGLNAYVYYIALPAMLFLVMARVDPVELLDLRFLGAFFVPATLVAVAGALVCRISSGRTSAALPLAGLAAGFANTGYMGIPLFVAAFGSAGASPAAIITMMYGLIGVTIAVIVIEADVKREVPLGARLGVVAKAVAVNPMIAAPVLGLFYAMTGLDIPRPAERFLDLLGQSAGPCALFALGMFLVGTRLYGSLREVAGLSALKLLVQPLLTWAMAVAVFDLPQDQTAYAVLLAAMPTAANVFVLAERYGTYGAESSGTIIVTTPISVLTMAAVVLIFGI